MQIQSCTICFVKLWLNTANHISPLLAGFLLSSANMCARQLQGEKEWDFFSQLACCSSWSFWQHFGGSTSRPSDQPFQTQWPAHAPSSEAGTLAHPELLPVNSRFQKPRGCAFPLPKCTSLIFLRASCSLVQPSTTMYGHVLETLLLVTDLTMGRILQKGVTQTLWFPSTYRSYVYI